MTTTRYPLDYYRTSEKLTKVLLETVNIEGSVLEPCAGDGAIADLLPDCYTNDVDPDHETDYTIDAADHTAWNLLGKWDWIVTNPPFNEANWILENAWEHSRVGIAFLLRLSYLEPVKIRRDFLNRTEDQLRYVIPVNPRPKFRPDKQSSDSCTVAWLVWKKNFSWDELGLDPPIQFISNWR